MNKAQLILLILVVLGYILPAIIILEDYFENRKNKKK